MDHLRSTTSALQQALTGVKSAIAALSTAPGESKGPKEGSEPPAHSESSNGLSDSQIQHRPSKASVHIDREDAPADESLDPRYQPDKWILPKPWRSYCVDCGLLFRAAGLTGDDEAVKYPMFILRHHNAGECVAGEPCEAGHWTLFDDCVAPRVEGCVNLQLLCTRTNLFKKQMGYCTCRDFSEDDDSITMTPCKLFNDLLPDFRSVKRAGYQVVVFRLVESWENEDFDRWAYAGDWMDIHGCLVGDRDELARL